MKKLILCLTLLVAAAPVRAHKEVVHQRITERVFQRLQIDFLSRIGVNRDRIIAGRSLEQWMAQGAFDQDRPLSNTVNHFLDPEHMAPLTVGSYPLCSACSPLFPACTMRSDLWSESALNIHGLRNARAYQYSALVSPQRGLRENATKETFYYLGQIVHLVEDAAQPEHTRNDQHASPSDGATEASLYEEWGLVHLDSTAPAVSFDGYPSVALETFRSYFHTDDRQGTQPAGRGMADFSNRNFVTQDTNYGDYVGSRFGQPCFTHAEPVQPDPLAARTVVEDEDVLRDDGSCCDRLRVLHRIYSLPMRDYYQATSQSDAFHTYESALDLESRRFDPSTTFFSLGEKSWRSRAEVLIPRAVGYAQGYVERFFRGKIRAAWRKREGGGYDIILTNLSSERIGGDAKITVLLVTGAANDSLVLQERPLVELVDGFSGLDPRETVVIQGVAVALPSGIDSITDLERRIAIKARLGDEEDAVIGLVQNPSSVVRLELTGCTPSCPGYLLAYDSQMRWMMAAYGQRARWLCSSPQPLFPVDAIPDSCSEDQLTPNTPPWAIVLNSFDPAQTYNVYVGGNSYCCTPQGQPLGTFADLTWRVLVGGRVVRQGTTRTFRGQPDAVLIFSYP